MDYSKLRANMMKLRGNMQRINNAAESAADRSGPLADNLEQTDTELAAHISDLEFVARAMGNSNDGVSVLPKVVSETAKVTEQAVHAVDVGKLADVTEAPVIPLGDGPIVAPAPNMALFKRG